MSEKDNGRLVDAPPLINEADFLATGFRQLDPTKLEARAPRVKLLPRFHERSHERQVEYLLKLASTMNNAARLIQDERDQLVDLMVQKEEQLKKMAAAVASNNAMLQAEVARMNAERQQWNAAAAGLRQRIRELENGGDRGA